MNPFREAIHNQMDELIAFRRELHLHPEVSFKEFETTDRICRELDKAGISYYRLNPTGLYGDLKGTKCESTHMVLLRSDMDALSIVEQTGLDFASVNEGVMHACGHDNHMTVLLAAVKYLHAHPEQFGGTVRFIFQPAEELGQGAKAMIGQGVMAGVDRAVGMHIDPILPCGQVSSMEGECWAACDVFKIIVHGKAAHGANPHMGHDALVAASAIVITVGSIVSGTRFNIVAGDAVMEGTCRTFSRDIHAALPGQMRRVVENVALAYGCTAELEFTVATEVLYSDPAVTRLGMQSVAKIVGEENAVTCGPKMIAEDFCYYTLHAPSVFFNLGARVADESKVFPLHSDHVVFDESAIEVGASVFIQTAVDLLDELNAQ